MYPGNDEADELAKDATKLEHPAPYCESLSNAKRRAKRATLKLWQQELSGKARRRKDASQSQTASNHHSNPQNIS